MTAQAKVIVEAPYWRTANADQFAAAKDVTGRDRLTPICRPTWRYPQRCTILSTLSPIIDTDPGRGANNVFTFARAHLKVTYGDGNITFRRDVLVGQPLEVIGSIVNVEAYLTVDNAYLGGIAGDTSFFPATVKTKVSVMVLEGRVDLEEAQILTSEYRETAITLPFGQDGSTYEGPSFRANFAPGPIRLHSLIGYQESGSDLYAQLFDYNAFACDYPNPNMTLVDHMSPIYEVKLFDGEDFSLVLDKGLVFQHGISAMFSSSPGVLTRVDPATIAGYRANWRWNEGNAFAAAGFAV